LQGLDWPTAARVTQIGRGMRALDEVIDASLREVARAAVFVD
jgi:hypothetical protein